MFFGGDGGRFQERQETPGPNWQTLIEGWAPHGVIEIPFGLQDDPGDWYKVGSVGDLVLDILSIAGMGAGDSGQIFLQQMRPY